MIQSIRKLFKMPDKRAIPQTAAQRGILPKKGKKFVMDGWVFEVKKITEKSMICTPLGVVVEKESSPIVQPRKSSIIMP